MSNVKKRFYSTRFNRGLPPELRFDEVIRIFSKLKGERLLDIGCGDGAVSSLLKESLGAKEVLGIDIAPEAVAAAQARGIKAYILDIDEENLPFDDNYFDLVYCGEIIEHVFDPDHLLEEVNRVLKQKGNCVISTPNLAGWPNRLALLLGYQPYPMAASPSHESVGKLIIKSPEGQWGHIRVMTFKAIEELVRLHGFGIRRTVGCVATIKSSIPLMNLIKAVDRVMSRIPSFSTRIIMVLEKQ